MHYDQLTRLVQLRGRFASPEDADRATRTTLCVLAERVPDTVATALVERLPPDLAAHLHRDPEPSAEPLVADDFVAQLAERASLDALRAARVARTVFRVVDLESGGSLAGRAKGVLPEDVRDLVARAGR
ncbi:uncharacterized protein (DUF2267 family) [Motilibacter rhizosphaerae]|uniref:Uncharacterized protein (DUF2267 family) n=1 Tax=Motilibacter rhizosphaerae TaxID=598652 RepID=A0A4Q7NGP2_9ACTN|nr:DUF2267 domain-containing protein [Motilibacter rhizosphaerae]RZS83002.1 uncharacterized protein (DUF2267 family) [Motilibacter rhizosphaerae]